MATPTSRSALFRKRGVILEGILVPLRWKVSGQVAALALNTLDDREYVIDDPGCETRGLLQHLRKRVRLTGAVIGNRVVQVTDVTVQDSLNMPGSGDKGDSR